MNEIDSHNANRGILCSIKRSITYLILGGFFVSLWACGQKESSSGPGKEAPGKPAAEPASLPPAGPSLTDFACALSTGSIPSEMKVGSVTKVEVSVTNKSSAKWFAFLSGRSGINAVNIAYRWFKDGKQVIEGDRAMLQADLNPGASAKVELGITAPNTPGSYVLQIEPVQEAVHWFTEVGGCKVSVPVRVLP